MAARGRQGGGESAYERIFAIVRRIPQGRVATYGQVAALAGLPGHARQVGYALHSLDESTTVPWHRVINSYGRVSRRATAGWEAFQRQLLEEEGVQFDDLGRVDLGRFRWEPPERVGRREQQPTLKEVPNATQRPVGGALRTRQTEGN